MGALLAVTGLAVADAAPSSRSASPSCSAPASLVAQFKMKEWRGASGCEHTSQAGKPPFAGAQQSRTCSAVPCRPKCESMVSPWMVMRMVPRTDPGGCDRMARCCGPPPLHRAKPRRSTFFIEWGMRRVCMSAWGVPADGAAAAVEEGQVHVLGLADAHELLLRLVQRPDRREAARVLGRVRVPEHDLLLPIDVLCSPAYACGSVFAVAARAPLVTGILPCGTSQCPGGP